MTTKKAKSGRPRKHEQTFKLGEAHLRGLEWRTPFECFDHLSHDELRKRLLAEIPEEFTDCSSFKEGSVTWARLPYAGDLEEWMEAARQEVDAGEALRAAYYLLWAVRCMQDNMASALGVAAAIGEEKLASDKKRGRRPGNPRHEKAKG